MNKNSRFPLLLVLLVLALLLTACPASTPPAQGEPPAEDEPQGQPPADEQPPKEEEQEEEPVIDPKDLVEGNPLYAELGRQQFHYSDQNSWMNDINGLVYFHDTWHMYYQKNPGTPISNTDDMHWGHAVSTDLVHWTQVEDALYPDADGAMWSGTAYADEGNRSGLFKTEKGGLVAAYSTEKQEIGIAYSEDGYTYEKLGIVIRNPGNRVDFRDPKIFYDEGNGKWTVVVAGGKVRLYQSTDLYHWELTSENEMWTECPDLFPMTVKGTDTVKWVLSFAGRSFYVGSYANGVFIPESERIDTNVGPDSYAGIIFENTPDGRILMVHWMNQWTYAQATGTTWCSNASLVHELTLTQDERGRYLVGFAPAAEYETLAGDTVVSLQNVALAPGEDLLAGKTGTYLRMDAAISLYDTTDFTLALRRGVGDEVLLSYDAASGEFTFDRSAGSVAASPLTNAYPTYTFRSSNSDGDTLRFTIFVDAAGFEMYIDETTYFAALIGVQDCSRGMSLTTKDGLLVESLTVREMKSAWFEDAAAVNGVHVSQKTVEVVIADGSYFLPVSSFGGEKPVFYTVADETLLTAEEVEGGVKLTGLAPGETALRARVRERYVEIKVVIHEETTRVSMLENFTVSGGELKETPTGYTLLSTGWDAFAISDTMAGDVIYEADITIDSSSRAAALAFRMNGDQNFYCVCIDLFSQYVKLWMKKDGAVTDLRAVHTKIEPGETYSLRIEAIGATITVYLNGNEIMRVVNDAHSYGALGINVCVGTGYFNHLRYEKP
ncbi:MAG: GH32 C-terminal domain-containing protein [Clostridia bacterium]|nr:GH32 C-terminal domain-containing protein [Clostridia bacterium]